MAINYFLGILYGEKNLNLRISSDAENYPKASVEIIFRV